MNDDDLHRVVSENNAKMFRIYLHIGIFVIGFIAGYAIAFYDHLHVLRSVCH